MPTHNDHTPHGHKNDEVDASLGYEPSDVKITGILVFLVAMGIFVVVTAVTCYGIGKVFNAYMNKEDGPNSKWTQTVDVRQLGNLPSSPELQNKVAEITRTFPTPRVQLDDGNQDIADLHARENLLLDNYTWIDQSKGTLRIPVERAMEIIARSGLPVAPAAQGQPLMTGDSRPVVPMPLTDGFAPTTYEQEQAAAEANMAVHNEAQATPAAR
ncbi:MAG TPA: hypothetical protein VL991_02205 [Terracidiphilus sp.]|jgi:hypothetical protein|nr:hypothetical protein [Terracidiphilus sp.]